MSILGAKTQELAPSITNDNAAIASLKSAFAAQRAAFHADRYPSLEERKARIGKLIGMLLTYRERISAALSKDFGCHPVPASDLIEVLGPVARAQYVLGKLEEWMRPSAREIDSAMMGTAQA